MNPKAFAFVLVFFALAVVLSGCVQEEQPAAFNPYSEVPELSEGIEAPVSELETELVYGGDVYLGTFDFVSGAEDLVDTGDTANGHRIYRGLRGLEDENRIYTENEDGYFETWVKEGAPLGDLYGCPPLAEWNGGGCEISEEDSMAAAEIYATETETYEFDGLQFTFEYKGSRELSCAYCWEFTFEFDSRYPGYGDRSSEELVENVTHHTIMVRTEQGEITYAVIDGVWDAFNSGMLGA